MPDLLQLALLIAILLPAGKLVASLCSRFGIPAIIGELMVGIVAGPGGFNLLHRGPFHVGQATNAFMLLAQVGGLLLMFIAGFETDIDRMREAGVTAFLVALSGVIWPFALGAGAAHLLGLSWTPALFIGGALTATSVSISARTLMDGGHMSSPEATVILGAAVIDDVMGLFVLAFLTASLSTGGSESFGAASQASSSSKTLLLDSAPSSSVANDAHQRECRALLCCRVRRCKALARPIDSADAQTDSKRVSNKLCVGPCVDIRHSR